MIIKNQLFNQIEIIKMKKIILVVLFLAFGQNILFAQAPINVVITGECEDVSGTYNFTGLVNGKNNYEKTFEIEGISIVIGVGFDNTKWVIYADGDITDDGFSNIAVPAGLLPPFTGWVNTGCLDGTLTINQNLSVNEATIFEKNVVLYPNPASNYVTIEHKISTDSKLEYNIIDIAGRIVGRGTSSFNENISIENLKAGNYIIKIKNEDGFVTNKKLIKN